MGPWAATVLLSCLAAVHLLSPASSSSSSQKECDNFPSSYYDEAAQKCCYRCPAGYHPKIKCPLDFTHGCIKIPCQPGFYLNHRLATPQCAACVQCAPGGCFHPLSALGFSPNFSGDPLFPFLPTDRSLVEVSPCRANFSRVCGCRQGWFCRTPVLDSCLRCAKHRSCGAGFGVRDTGTAEKDTVCEECPPGTFSDQDSPSQPCRRHTNCSTLRKPMASHGNTTHDAQCADLVTSRPAKRATEDTGSIAIEEASARGEWDLSLLGGLLLSGLVLCACSVAAVWRRRRACSTWILPQKMKLSNQAKICAKEINLLNSVEEEEGGDAPGPDGDSEMEAVLELVQADGGGAGDALPQCTNCIEKIYIMRADTVIVGSVSEAPTGKKDDGGSGDPEEWSVAVRYPEQETEPPPGSDLTTPVEEEWESHYSGGKTLAI
ncbi:tumor necrosis factor receptor superfamily member 8-like [Anolis carolinensis]|uniref:tumor necrosis factor receptor superfamily member 8-like n=1 Tax=Anolis carolinensis TaxID=28377 RepID=UPI002F2B7BEE